jgi:hypothetical protein
VKRKEHDPEGALPPDLRVANCAACGAPVTADRAQAERHRLERLAGRIHGRPYCDPCLHSDGIPGSGGGRAGPRDDSPWQQNAVRILEGDA